MCDCFVGGWSISRKFSGSVGGPYYRLDLDQIAYFPFFVCVHLFVFSPRTGSEDAVALAVAFFLAPRRFGRASFAYFTHAEARVRLFLPPSAQACGLARGRSLQGGGTPGPAVWRRRIKFENITGRSLQGAPPFYPETCWPRA